MGKRKKFKCKNEAQKRAIKASYAKKAAQNKKVESVKTPPTINKPVVNRRALFPLKFPFWARFKPNKGRTTLVIDEEQDNKSNIQFVHREAIHCTEDNRYVLSGDYEKIYPNPDKTDKNPMYLKRPHKHSISVFEPHNKNLDMPEDLRQRYDKNNHKGDTPDGTDGNKKV